MNTMKANHGDRHHDHDQDQAGRQCALTPQFQHVGERRGQLGDDAGEYDQRNAVAMPREVICSPSHIRNMVPPVSVIAVERRKNSPGSLTTLPAPSRPTAMP